MNRGVSAEHVATLKRVLPITRLFTLRAAIPLAITPAVEAKLPQLPREINGDLWPSIPSFDETAEGAPEWSMSALGGKVRSTQLTCSFVITLAHVSFFFPWSCGIQHRSEAFIELTTEIEDALKVETERSTLLKVHVLTASVAYID